MTLLAVPRDAQFWAHGSPRQPPTSWIVPAPDLRRVNVTSQPHDEHAPRSSCSARRAPAFTPASSGATDHSRSTRAIRMASARAAATLTRPPSGAPRDSSAGTCSKRHEPHAAPRSARGARAVAVRTALRRTRSRSHFARQAFIGPRSARGLVCPGHRVAAAVDSCDRGGRPCRFCRASSRRRLTGVCCSSALVAAGVATSLIASFPPGAPQPGCCGRAEAGNVRGDGTRPLACLAALWLGQFARSRRALSRGALNPHGVGALIRSTSASAPTTP